MGDFRSEGIAVVDPAGEVVCLCWSIADAEKVAERFNTLLRDVRVLQAEVMALRALDNRKEPCEHEPHDSPVWDANVNLMRQAEAATAATDNSGALTRWGGGGKE